MTKTVDPNLVKIAANHYRFSDKEVAGWLDEFARLKAIKVPGDAKMVAEHHRRSAMREEPMRIDRGFFMKDQRGFEAAKNADADREKLLDVVRVQAEKIEDLEMRLAQYWESCGDSLVSPEEAKETP